jgi:GntR family transcriptional regulator
MILRIDTTSSIPVYDQIVEQAKRAVASGAIRPGDALPSLREAARTLRINPLTVAKAYKQLEQDGVIETRHGLGSYVSASAPSSAAKFGKQALARGIDSVLLDAMQLGVAFDEVRELFDQRAVALDPDNGGANNVRK